MKRAVRLSEREFPVWTDDALSRLLGACDGYAHSLVAIRTMIARFDGAYAGRFDPRHVRKIAQRDAVTKPLRELDSRLEADLRRCQEAYKREYERAHPSTQSKSPQDKT